MPLFPWLRRWFGIGSERRAERFLRRQGYRILARNWSSSFGELDLIALDGRTVVFVEVRSSAGTDGERPAASVDERKQRKLTRVALHFLQKNRLLDRPARFDVVTLHPPASQDEPVVTHYINAFAACD